MDNINIKVGGLDGAKDRTVQLPDGRILKALWLDDFTEEDFKRWSTARAATETLGEAMQVSRAQIKEFVPVITDDDLKPLTFRNISSLLDALMTWERMANVPEGTPEGPLASPPAQD